MRRPVGLSLALGLVVVGALGAPGVGARRATPAPTNDPNAAKDVAHRFVAEVLSQGNVAASDELVAPDFVDHQPFPGVPPTREGLEQAIPLFRAAFPDGRFAVEDLFAKGDRVALRTTFRGTHQGEYAGVPATGKQVEFASIDILRVAGGRMAEHWGLSDDLGLLTQLGVIPAPGATGTPAP